MHEPLGIDHFILTSFSVRHASLDQTRVNGRAIGGLPDEIWLRARIELFERFCLPSVLGQTRQDFKWIVYISSENPSWLHRYFESLGLPNLHVEAIDGTLHGPELLRPLLALARGSQLLTTRLDNDDALSVDFVSRLRTVCSSGVGLYSFLNGIQLMPWGITRQRLVNNAFLSLLEDLKPDGQQNVSTVLQIRHDLKYQGGQVVKLGGKPAWMQVVHGANLGNQPSGFPSWTHPERDRFPIPEDVPNLSFLRYVLDVKPHLRAHRRIRAATARMLSNR